MKNKQFYEPLVETSEMSLEIAELNLSPDERVHLVSLIEANIHSSVVETVLSNLPEREKKVFLKNLIADNHEATWRHLRENVSDIENKIILAISELKKELIRDMKKAKKTK